MKKEEEVLKGEAFIAEALPIWREIEEEKEARESLQRYVYDYRDVDAPAPSGLSRGVADSLSTFGSYQKLDAASLDLHDAYHQLPAGLGGRPADASGRDRSSSSCVSSGSPVSTSGDNNIGGARADGVGIHRRWDRGDRGKLGSRRAGAREDRGAEPASLTER